MRTRRMKDEGKLPVFDLNRDYRHVPGGEKPFLGPLLLRIARENLAKRAKEKKDEGEA
jgi:hypothetical protein